MPGSRVRRREAVSDDLREGVCVARLERPCERCASMTLHAREWGEPDAPLLICLHGVGGNGGHFGELGERLADRFHIIALDLLGHGLSRFEPPWDLQALLDGVLSTVGERQASWLGHSWGARVVFEVAAAHPSVVQRLVLLDPALLLTPAEALSYAEEARVDESYDSFEELVDRRFQLSRLTRASRPRVETELREHCYEGDDGRWRYRYCQSAVVTAYNEMSRTPPSFDRVDVRTLLVLGETSHVSYDALLDAHVAALGERLRVVRVPGGHTVLWDAADETIDAVERFLEEPPV
jgi:lipase